MSNIFNAENSHNWWCLFLLMLISFLLGWILAWWLTKKKYEKELEDCRKKKTNFLTPQSESSDKIDVVPTKIKAVKTMERSGNAVERPALNFESFGAASEAEKDDLKRISGVGPFIEDKLNSIGIFTYDQISRFTNEDIETVTKLIEFFPGRILRDDWRGQASTLKEGGQTKFSERVDKKEVDYDKDSKDE